MNLTLSVLRKITPTSLKKPLKKALGIPQTRLDSDWKILKPIGPLEGKHVVLDIGAHHGWFFHCWQDWCPEAEIHAFEPFPQSFREMSAIYGNDTRVIMNQVGVSDSEGELELNVMSESLVSNSFLKHNQAAWDEVQFKPGEVVTQQVPITTIRQYLTDKEIEGVYLAKIDVQGYELKVLQGAGECLQKIDHIFVESAIQPLYEEAPDFTDIFRFLTEKGFHLMALRSWHRGNHVLMETDMLFRRNDLKTSVNEEINRVVEQA